MVGVKARYCSISKQAKVIDINVVHRMSAYMTQCSTWRYGEMSATHKPHQPNCGETQLTPRSVTKGHQVLLYSGRTPMYFVGGAVVSTTAQWTITTAQWKLLLHSRQLHSYGLLTRVWQVDKPTALLGYPAALKYGNLPYSITLSPRHHNLTHVSHPPPSVKLGNFQSIPWAFSLALDSWLHCQLSSFSTALW